MDRLTIILICVIAFCVCMILYKLVSKGEAKLKNKQQKQARAQFNPEQLKFLQTVGSLFKENRGMPLLKVYEECGMPYDIVYGNNSTLIDEHIPFEKGSDGDNVFKTYAFAVSKRDMLKNSPLMEHPNDVLNLNLHKGENIYHVIYGVVFYQEKTTVTNIAYSGCRWTSGPLRTGTLNVITNEYTHFTPADSGHLVFTNERLIFVGKQKNITKQIKLSDILYNNMYQDGVMVHIPNRKPLLFKFPEHKDFEIYEVADGINEFAIVFDRLRSGDYKQNHSTPTKSIDVKERLSIVEVLKAKNYDPQIAEILSLAKAGETAQISSIQRKYEMGYSKAGKLMDQMECLQFVTPYKNGKREWLVNADDIDTILSLIKVSKPMLSYEN